MDKLVIIGGYEYLGFYLCTHYLEKGLQVIGVHLEIDEESIYEEKRFTVGRNANFLEMSMKEWINNSSEDVEKSLIVISLFDVCLRKEKEFEENLLQLFLKKNLRNCEVLLLLPIQYLSISAQMRDISDMLSNLEKMGQSLKIVYLPTLYGPWQPNEYLFQQALLLNELAEEQNLQVNQVEYVNDAIYILDAIKEIERIVDNVEIQTCLLQSEMMDHWKKCAELLMIHPSVYHEALDQQRLSCSIPVIKVKQSIGFEKGLEKQKEYVKRLLRGFL